MELGSIAHSRPSVDAQELRLVQKVLQRRALADGTVVAPFEEKLARTVGVRYALAVSSGSAALHLALLALSVRAGDEILLPSYTCAALLNAIFYLQAQPIPCDIELETYNMDGVQARRNQTSKTKALILPYMFGYPTDPSPFLALGIPVIEDVSMALGARYAGKPLGSWGEVAIVSFYATKFITTGVGGAVLTNSSRCHSFLRDLLRYDKREAYRVRYNYTLSDLQAALGLAQLQKLPRFVRQRQALAQRYQQNLSTLPLCTPTFREPAWPIYYRYLVRLPRRAQAGRLRTYLQTHRVESPRPVYKPLHRYLHQPARNYPMTETAFGTTVSLPLYPDLSLAQADHVTHLIHRFFR